MVFYWENDTRSYVDVVGDGRLGQTRKPRISLISRWCNPHQVRNWFQRLGILGEVGFIRDAHVILLVVVLRRALHETVPIVDEG